MDSFYIIVGTIAILLLIGILAFLGVAMNKQYVNRPFPSRTIQKCPDYWQVDGSYCVIPITGVGLNNVGDLGNGSGLHITKQAGAGGQYDILFTPGLDSTQTKIDFTKDDVWKTYNTMVGSNLNPSCQKQQWLNDHKVVWDGISNGDLC